MTKLFSPTGAGPHFIYSTWCNLPMELGVMEVSDCVNRREADRVVKLLSTICDGETYSRSTPVYGLHCEDFSAVIGFLPDEAVEKGRDSIQIGLRMHHANRVLQAAGYGGVSLHPWPALRPLLVSPPHPAFGILGIGEGCRSAAAAIRQADALLRMGHVVLHVHTETKWRAKDDPVTLVTRARVDELLQEDDEL